MCIELVFQFTTESRPSAFTGVEDDVVDLILPSIGDLVTHRDVAWKPFSGRVADRTFSYAMPAGEDVNGAITITLFLNRPLQH